ncbi:hypothetical protein F8M49_14090 [Rhodococcus zopfii]|uniref:Uncharacterized protein n=1 Tax=Rhodococcus zopfii TaxID=43772 RepID=A0ABU3WQJ1_9NOCA|nr:hypothetical protein [Rhodococcus zopfii]
MGKGNKKIEITDRIERMEALEDRFGITLESLYAIYRKDEYDGTLDVNYDVLAPGNIDHDINITVSLYNSNKQLVATTSTSLYADDFLGIQSCSESFYDVDEPPALVRILPSKS